MNATIVKVQRPLSWTGRRPDCLIYDQARQHAVEQPVDAAVLKALGDDAKGYFSAEWSGRRWAIGERVEEQPW